MGNLALTIVGSKESQTVAITPANNEWVTSHASWTGLSIVEVERLWLRFQQLGANEKGEITDQKINDANSPLGLDKFLKNIFLKLKTEPGPMGVVKFRAFCNFSKWFGISTIDDKIKASFALLNNGSLTINEQLFLKILPSILPGKTAQEYDRINRSIFDSIGKANPNGTGRLLHQEDYLTFIKTNISHEKLRNLFSLNIIPEQVKNEALKKASAQTVTSSNKEEPTVERKASNNKSEEKKSPPAAVVGASYSIVNDAQIFQVAQSIGQRDFRLLANKLGFFESDVNHMENLYPGDKQQVIIHMLQQWRRREESRAFVIYLQKALHEAKFADIASLLRPN